MSQVQDTIEQDAATSLQLFRLMKPKETEGSRLEAIIRVAVVRLYQHRTSEEVADFLRQLVADRAARAADRPELRDGVPRRLASPERNA